MPLATDKTAAGQMLAELVCKAELGKAGIVDPFAEHRKRPLLEHVADYEAYLLGKGDGRQHARDAAALGVKPHCIGPLVRRWGLAANGNGKKRRYPRDTFLALAERLARAPGPATINHYVRSLRGFTRWLVRDRRLGDDPLAALTAVRAAVDVRRGRRELTAEELAALLSAAGKSERPFRGLTGWDRFHLYATACGTGFRTSALASLTPESFDLDAEPPVVTLAARRNKSRVQKVQPLPPEVARLLADYLDGKPASQNVCGGTWATAGDAAEMLRIDLDAAGIPYAVEGPDGPLYADFHALRHTYLTLEGRAGIDLRTLQELAGDSTPILTARYSHRRLYDLAGAVEKLPDFLPPEDGIACAREALPATGMDGRIRTYDEIR